jgi:hypothetical protein
MGTARFSEEPGSGYRELPTVRIGSKTYYFDARLMQLRSTVTPQHGPIEFIDFKDFRDVDDYVERHNGVWEGEERGRNPSAATLRQETGEAAKRVRNLTGAIREDLTYIDYAVRRHGAPSMGHAAEIVQWSGDLYDELNRLRIEEGQSPVVLPDWARGDRLGQEVGEGQGPMSSAGIESATYGDSFAKTRLIVALKEADNLLGWAHRASGHSRSLGQEDTGEYPMDESAEV